MIDALGEADHAEHAGEPLQLQKAFPHQEVGAEEQALFDQKRNLLIHECAVERDRLRQNPLQEVFHALRLICRGFEIQPREGERAAANRQDVITACNAIFSGIRLLIDRVVGKARLCAGEVVSRAARGERVRRDRRIIQQRDTRRCVLQFVVAVQNDLSRERRLRADICVRIGV